MPRRTWRNRCENPLPKPFPILDRCITRCFEFAELCRGYNPAAFRNLKENWEHLLLREAEYSSVVAGHSRNNQIRISNGSNRDEVAIMCCNDPKSRQGRGDPIR